MMVVATAGHVDHGKSSLVLALTGTDPDRFEEEKRRGLTIDLGFAHTTLPSGSEIGFVDVPGHERFVANMLAGVGAVDACSSSSRPTRAGSRRREEHLASSTCSVSRHGVVALTKSRPRRRRVARARRSSTSRDHLAGTFLADAPDRARSARPPVHGLDELAPRSTRSSPRTPAAADRGRPRLWIDRVFAAKGSGTVVTGTLTGGPLAVDDTVASSRGRTAVRIRSIQSLGRRSHGSDRATASR